MSSLVAVPSFTQLQMQQLTQQRIRERKEREELEKMELEQFVGKKNVMADDETKERVQNTIDKGKKELGRLFELWLSYYGKAVFGAACEFDSRKSIFTSGWSKRCSPCVTPYFCLLSEMEVERLTYQKRQGQISTTRNWQKNLQKIQDRVKARPLLMERTQLEQVQFRFLG